MKLPVWLWPIKTGQTFFDVWSICHFAAGVIIGYDVAAQNRSLLRLVIITLILGYLWEVVETGIEKFFPKFIKHHEGKLNRWVSDPLMVLVGALLGSWLVGFQ